jgi:hypothetical protein
VYAKPEIAARVTDDIEPRRRRMGQDLSRLH